MNNEKPAIVSIFNSAAAMFLACALIWCVESLIFDAQNTFDTARLIFSFFIAGLSIAFLQYIWFTDRIIKNMSYVVRVFLFAICIYASLAGCVQLGCWFPVDNLAAWTGFTIAFLTMTIVMTVGFHLHVKRTVGSYDEALKAYHNKQNESNNR